MFDFMSMAGTYKQRLVENTTINGAEIDTVRVTDSLQPYETAISHESYNSGAWVVVEMYDLKELAEIGHAKWVEIFKKEKLPIELKDVSTSTIKRLLDSISN